jgi:deoxyuridine 5'-triphosphate nucleotidohydrolase
MDLRVKLLHPDATIPTRSHEGDAGLDLYLCEDINIWELGTIGFGLAVEIPFGYVGKIVIRSGLAAKGVMLAQGTGVIDSGYRGELTATLYYPERNIINSAPSWVGQTVKRLEPLRMEKGERVCQLLIEPIELPDVIVVNELSESERGECGFGSSGR